MNLRTLPLRARLALHQIDGRAAVPGPAKPRYVVMTKLASATPRCAVECDPYLTAKPKRRMTRGHLLGLVTLIAISLPAGYALLSVLAPQ